MPSSSCVSLLRLLATATLLGPVNLGTAVAAASGITPNWRAGGKGSWLSMELRPGSAAGLHSGSYH